jgi:PQQ-dependent catabolism-associated beta-propeller protein
MINILLLFVAVMFSSVVNASKAYITNEKDNTLSVIDINKRKVVKTIDIGQRPRGITMTKDGKLVLICASDDDRVEVRDAETLKLKYHLPSGPDPELFVLSPDDSVLYIANEDDAMVTVVDMNEKMIIDDISVGVEPEGMGLVGNGSILVNTSETTNMAHFIDTETLEIVENVLVDARPRVAMFTPDDKEVWVSSEIGGTVKVINPNSKEVTHTIGFEIPGVNEESIQPVGVKHTKNGKYTFVALGPANRIAVIDQKSKEVVKYLLVGQRVWQLAFSNDQKTLLSTNGVSNDVSFINVEKLKVEKSVKVGRFPWGVVVSP